MPGTPVPEGAWGHGDNVPAVEEEVDSEEEDEEAIAPRKARDPSEPTAAMREAHEATHLPYRSWCPHCVMCRKDNPGHTRVGAAEVTVPEVSIDYAFIRREEEADTQTVLVMKDRKSRALRAWLLRSKGIVQEETVEQATAGVLDFGFAGEVVLKGDNEPALITLRDAIKARLPGALTVPVPPRESQSNGVVENGVKLWKAMLRVHLSALEAKIEGHIPSDHPVMAWMVPYVSDVITKYLQSADGRTAYERLYGKPVREEGLEFGEQLYWRRQKRTDMNVVLEQRWQPGTWLGRQWGSKLHKIAVGNEVIEARAIQRKPRSERWDRTALESIAATP